jgi:hypothetical protein
MYDAGHGEGGRTGPDSRARELRGPGRHGSGQALGLQEGYGVGVPLEEELPLNTPPQPPACDGTCLIREQRQRVGRESDAWQVGAPTARPRAGRRLASCRGGRQRVRASERSSTALSVSLLARYAEFLPRRLQSSPLSSARLSVCFFRSDSSLAFIVNIPPAGAPR